MRPGTTCRRSGALQSFIQMPGGDGGGFEAVGHFQAHPEIERHSTTSTTPAIRPYRRWAASGRAGSGSKGGGREKHGPVNPRDESKALATFGSGPCG